MVLGNISLPLQIASENADNCCHVIKVIPDFKFESLSVYNLDILIVLWSTIIIQLYFILHVSCFISKRSLKFVQFLIFSNFLPS